MTPFQVRVVLVDDHEMFREAVAQSLSAHPAITISGHCSTVQDAIDLVARREVDVVLLDYDLHVERGSSFVSWAADHQFEGAILVLTAAVSDADAIWLIQHGVAGIFLKDRPLRELANAIISVASGGKCLDPSYLRILMDAMASGVPAPSGPKFTERERLTLRGLVEGYSNKEIAAQLDTSEAAIKATVQRLFDKLGVRSRGHLIRLVLQDYQNEL